MLSEVRSEVGYLFDVLSEMESEVTSEVDFEVSFPMLIHKRVQKCIFLSQVNSEVVYDVNF